MSEQQCRGTNARGEPCGSFIVDEDGWCPTHRPGNEEIVREWRAKGGLSTKAKWDATGLDPEEIVDLETLDDAKAALDQVRRAVLQKRLFHSEANACSKAIAEWVKTEAANMTRGLVNDLRDELEAKTKEIEALRQQISGGKKLRAVR